MADAIRAAERAVAADDHVALRQRTSRLLRRDVGFDLAVWATIDPTTLMWTHCILEGMDPDPELEHAVFVNEYHDDDVLKLRTLAHTTGRVGTLVQATEGRPERSRRYDELYRPIGFVDELRMLFMDEGSAWGALVLCRDGAVFTARDVERVARLGQPFGGALRRSLLTGAARNPGSLDAPPGLLLVSPHGEIEDATPEARALIHGLGAGELATVVRSVVAARAGQAGRAALATGGGRWLAFHATMLGERSAVIVELVRSYALADLIVRARGLTGREREVVELVAQGRSTAQIARALTISDYTVQDHLKSVFGKFGVNSRQELVAELFFGHYAPMHDSGATPSPYGWYLDRA